MKKKFKRKYFYAGLAAINIGLFFLLRNVHSDQNTASLRGPVHNSHNFHSTQYVERELRVQNFLDNVINDNSKQIFINLLNSNLYDDLYDAEDKLLALLAFSEHADYESTAEIELGKKILDDIKCFSNDQKSPYIPIIDEVTEKLSSLQSYRVHPGI